MDVSKFDFESDGEWVAIEVVSDVVLEPFRFKVQPLLEASIVMASKSPDVVTRSFIEAVVDWDFVDGTGPLPCTAENKTKYLTRFATYIVKSMNGVALAGTKNMASAVLDFASNPDSFLKN